MALRTPFKNVINELMRGRSVKSKVWRRLLDKNPDVQQYFDLDNKYKARYNEFLAAFESAAKETGMSSDELSRSRKRFDFEGEKFQFSTGSKAANENLNFRQIKTLNKKLFPELRENYEFGHKNISVLRSLMAVFLSEMKPNDPRRKEVLALYSVVKEIDAMDSMQGTRGENKDILIGKLRAIAEQGPNLKSSWSKDVDITTGVSGRIEIEAEWDELNQFKGQLSSWVGTVFGSVVRGETDAFIKQMGNIDVTNIQGSPTLVEDLTANLVEELDPKKKRKRKTSSTSIRTRAKKRTESIRKKKKLKSESQRKKMASKGASSQPLYLLGILNKELPDVVRKNMGAPALTNRSGRFASSVRAVDVTQTAKGFPSIGYTYRKNPYQTFETGNRQGSADYDPRKLIDKSIREIAIQFAVGRFYTRRI
jgi:hypothetical protein